MLYFGPLDSMSNGSDYGSEFVELFTFIFVSALEVQHWFKFWLHKLGITKNCLLFFFT
jgi:hypothetical protein